ncbi:type 2 lanthipeptide synthetase LanM family protein [Streptomyces sp. AC550_RSS872]|uniref:type 2 lanthipeptide synthetase LanM family protein n=1 Tax=Streptomyces sp. AC550_RSS872 TaxID=2823689 RepID=UPI001C274E45|nr:type 2 lanthipeptide synthetase LanM family protein [Streptomyces sp. AC550_RSS872]
MSTASDLPVEEALDRLRAWKGQKPFERGRLFAQRLALDSLSERDLLALLAEPPERLKARIQGPPDWLIVLRRAFTHRDSGVKPPPLLEKTEADHPLHGGLSAISPLLLDALDSLQERVRSLRGEVEFFPFEMKALPGVFVANLAPLLLFQLSRPLVLELHVARLKGHLRGGTAEERFEDFIRRLGQESSLVELLAQYPVLARQLVLMTEQWADYLYEFLTHLCADWQSIRTTFAPGGDPGPLVDVDAGKGDRHRHGRSVLLLRFASELKLLYKPRSLGLDMHFQELLSWLNDRGAEPRLRPLVVVDRGNHGWSEFVDVASCTCDEEVVRFYERQGSYLALFYVLDAADLHNENLLAAGEHPMPVDLEALFHPYVHAKGPAPENLAAGALDRSVWQVGLLPRRVWSDQDSIGVDMSGLGGQPGQMNPHRLVSWERPGTDEMRVVRRRAELPVSENRPRLGDQDVEVWQYKDAVLAGFTGMYRLLRENRAELLAEQLPRFAQDETRVVVRSTNVYGLLWYESFHPDLLRDALERDRFFDHLWTEAAQRPYLVPLIPAEQRDLRHGDIPLFSSRPGSRALRTTQGARFEDFFDASGLDLVRQRVEQLGDDDLAKQLWITEASLATLLMDHEDPLSRPAQVPSVKRLSPGPRPVDREQLLALAGSVGRRLGELSLHNEGGAYWLGVGPLDESTWGLFPSGSDLYSGTSGIALFLGYLGAIAEEPSVTLLARRALTSARMQAREWLELREQPQASGSPETVGAFDGLASVVYALTSLGVLWAEPDLLDEAAELADGLPPVISRDVSLDVVYGSAGCVLALLSLYAVRPSAQTLAVAIRCGERLLATVLPVRRGVAWTTLEDQPPLGGFSHGTAGIALSLLRLAAQSGEDRFRRTALSALGYDRSLFLPELNNWADLRVFASRASRADPVDPVVEPPHKSMVAWCHGAPGIGLARLAALDQLADAATRDEIDIALSATKQYGFAMGHSLCHGALGNIELLLTAARSLDRPEDHEALARATASVVAHMEANGFVTGVPLGVETPGLMTGLAGIGYELLRLAEPDKVPSVLLLAPARWQAQG